MDVVYRRGRATAAEIHEQLPDPPCAAAVRTLLRILEDKGHLRHEKDGPRHIYYPDRAAQRRAAIGREAPARHVLQRLARRGGRGAARRVGSAAVERRARADHHGDPASARRGQIDAMTRVGRASSSLRTRTARASWPPCTRWHSWPRCRSVRPRRPRGSFVDRPRTRARWFGERRSSRSSSCSSDAQFRCTGSRGWFRRSSPRRSSRSGACRSRPTRRAFRRTRARRSGGGCRHVGVRRPGDLSRGCRDRRREDARRVASPAARRDDAPPQVDRELTQFVADALPARAVASCAARDRIAHADRADDVGIAPSRDRRCRARGALGGATHSSAWRCCTSWRTCARATGPSMSPARGRARCSGSIPACGGSRARCARTASWRATTA